MKQLLWSVAFIVGSSSLVNAQTIADLARQARAKRQASPNIVVITNKDVKTEATVPNPDEEKPGDESSAEKPVTEAPPAAAADGHDEKWWRGQFEKVRVEIQKLEIQVPVLESSLQTANREFLTRSYDPDGRGKRAIDESKSRLEEAKDDLAKARTRLTTLEDDLRRAGAPAGWAR